MRSIRKPNAPRVRFDTLKENKSTDVLIIGSVIVGVLCAYKNGKRISRNGYVSTREECEEKLAKLIKAMKSEIAEMKKQAKNA